MKIIDSKIVDCNWEEFSKIPGLDCNLGYAALLGLSKETSKPHIYDFSLKRELDRGTTLAVALALKEYIQREFPTQKRIGIALPSCFPGIVVNLAVQMAGKSSVNVNFTMGEDAAKAAYERVGLECIIGSNKVREKVDEHCKNYPWTDDFRDIADILKSLGKKAILPKLIMVKLMPAKFLAWYYKIPKVGGDKEASIIFTSGSEGAPKAAMLTHRNLVANAHQIEEVHLVVGNCDTLLANLPLFHSFGQTIQVWFTSMFKVPQVTVQSPLEVQANLKAIKERGATVIISTPTFLRSYYKKATSADFPKLKNVIAGAEKTPEGFAEAWMAKFPSVRYLEGYGLTEASPVVAVNLPSDIPPRRFGNPNGQARKHSVGELFPGMQAAIVSPETGEFLEIGKVGLLYLKGDNVFKGYYNQPEEDKKRFDRGWLNTGDLAMLDEDGFIYIKGRISRFSKIGGEMVPHYTVEAAIIKALGIENSEKNLVAIGSRPDSAKGEALVLLSAIDVDMAYLRQKLVAAGLPNLWIPKQIVRLDEIPVLSTGKLDLGKIQKICKFS